MFRIKILLKGMHWNYLQNEGSEISENKQNGQRGEQQQRNCVQHAAKILF